MPVLACADRARRYAEHLMGAGVEVVVMAEQVATCAGAYRQDRPLRSP
jgi:hypothetical protein